MIEPNGLGIVFNIDIGPVLFSCDHIWINGEHIDAEDALRDQNLNIFCFRGLIPSFFPDSDQLLSIPPSLFHKCD